MRHHMTASEYVRSYLINTSTRSTDRAQPVLQRLVLGCFKHGQLDPQLASQLDPNSNPNLIRVGVQVGVSCLNAKLCGTI